MLSTLDQIGKDNNGTRAFGTPGYKASVDFVLSYAVERFSDVIDTQLWPFNMTVGKTRNFTLIGPGGEKVFGKAAENGPSTPLPGGLTAPLVETPVNEERGSMCAPEDWQGIDAKGKIALIARGVCYFSQKVMYAKAAGAIGVLVYNSAPGENFTAPQVQVANQTQIVPMALISQEVGLAWKERLAKKEELTVTLVIDTFLEDVESWNVIAETKEGDPDNVVMMGAHLDSVPEGPGINDDGSGSAGLLAIMASFQKYTGLKNKVRFAWWGAEEEGLVGSLKYTQSLTEQEADSIRYYFNYDMIGSIKPDYIVYDGEKTGTGLLAEYLRHAGRNASIR
jgi:aminopeptidase Y